VSGPVVDTWRKKKVVVDEGGGGGRWRTGLTRAIAYGTVCVLWLALSRLLPYWRAPIRVSFERPWREVGYALLAALLVIGPGQLWMHGVRLPNDTPWRPVFESINQILIFSPMLLLLLWRRQPLASAWLPGGYVAPRLAVGLGFDRDSTRHLHGTGTRCAKPLICFAAGVRRAQHSRGCSGPSRRCRDSDSDGSPGRRDDQ
jgi:hypothetical protein